MFKRSTGIGFCLIAAMLYASRFLTAALYAPQNAGTWGSNQFASYLSYVGPPWFCGFIG